MQTHTHHGEESERKGGRIRRYLQSVITLPGDGNCGGNSAVLAAAVGCGELGSSWNWGSSARTQSHNLKALFFSSEKSKVVLFAASVGKKCVVGFCALPGNWS